MSTADQNTNVIKLGTGVQSISEYVVSPYLRPDPEIDADCIAELLRYDTIYRIGGSASRVRGCSR